MIQNVASTERAFWFVISALLFSLIFIIQDDLRWIGWFGVVPLVTGLIGSCPRYILFGTSTCPNQRKG